MSTVWELILCAKLSSWYATSHAAWKQSILIQVFSTNWNDCTIFFDVWNQTKFNLETLCIVKHLSRCCILHKRWVPRLYSGEHQDYSGECPVQLGISMTVLNSWYPPLSITITPTRYWTSPPGFLSGIFFRGHKLIVMQISIVMLIFLLFSDQTSGGANCLWGAPSCPPPPVDESQRLYCTHILLVVLTASSKIWFRKLWSISPGFWYGL